MLEAVCKRETTPQEVTTSAAAVGSRAPPVNLEVSPMATMHHQHPNEQRQHSRRYQRLFPKELCTLSEAVMIAPPFLRILAATATPVLERGILAMGGMRTMSMIVLMMTMTVRGVIVARHRR